MKELMLIINPVAGRGMYKLGFAEALETLSAGGWRTTLFYSTHAGEPAEFAQAHAKDFDGVACIGGDGTLSDVVGGLMRAGLSAPPLVGYFPLGTANDVATTLKLPKNDPSAAARTMVGGVPTPWDVGKLGESDYFTYVAAFGAFTDVSYETSQQSKQTLGHLAYLLEGMNRLPRLPHYRARVELDGGRAFEGDYIFGALTNSTSVGGLVKLDANKVALDDGLFELSLIRYPANIAELSALMSEVATKEYEGEYLTITETSRARFIFGDDVPWTRDGEAGGSFSDVTAVNCARAISVLA